MNLLFFASGSQGVKREAGKIGKRRKMGKRDKLE
jgi:hypothetical protein